MIPDVSSLSGAAAWVAHTSCSATAVAAVILLVQWTFRHRLSAGIRYALWLVLVARLAMPLSLESRWSVFNAAHIGPPRVRTLGPPVPAVASPVSPAPPRPGGSADQVFAAPLHPPQHPPEGDTRRQVHEAPLRPMPASLVISASQEGIPWTRLFPWVWFAGVLCFAIRRAGQNISFGVRLRSARRLEEPALLESLRRAAREIGVRRAPAVFETDAVTSPALYGLWRPRLLLPVGLANSLTPAELRFVFLHELAHLKRRDLLVHWFVCGLQAVHWFNPALWFAFARMRADRELACDALALARAGEGAHRAYGATLLKILEGASRPVAAPGLVGIAEDLGQLKARMRMIAQYQGRPGKRVFPLLLLTLLALVTLTDAQTEKPRGNAPTPTAPSQPPKAAPIAESALAQDGRLLLEMGKLDDAERKLQEALRRQPDDKHAAYYLGLVREARFAQENRKRESSGVLPGGAEESHGAPYDPRKVPAAGSTTVTNLTATSRGRQVIQQKLDRIVLADVRYDALPLSEVVRDLIEQARRKDPDNVGLNIILNPSVSTNEANGDANHASSGKVSLNDVVIRLFLKQVRLVDVLDAVCKVAETPLQYSIEDYAVVFTQRKDEPQPLFTRTYRVDPNTFMDGLRTVYGESPNAPDAFAEPIDISKGQVGKPGDIPNGRIGVSGVSTNSATAALIRRFFAAAGVDFSSAVAVNANGLPQPSSKALFFNDRTGLLLVRATMAELDIIEKAIQVANTAPPQISITARLIELPSGDEAKPLGFDWFLGNTLMSPGTTNRVEAATNGASGVFPAAPGGASGGLTSGLRTAPRTTGVLTDKQAQAVVRAIERGAIGRIVANPTVTTVSGRQIRTEVPDAGFSLDVVPRVMADGFTVHVDVFFTLSAEAEAASGQGEAAHTQSAALRTSTSAMVWDGQTMLLGPFPSRRGDVEKRVLLLVTPTLVDPAGNRVHASP